MSSGPSGTTSRTSGTITPAACPGRHELDETQELQYRAIMTALASLGYQGFIGQEFIPSARGGIRWGP